MTLSEEAKAIIEIEERILTEVLDSLRSQQKKRAGKLVIEEQRARTLTAEIVRTRRDEDKVQLASDEAVSHGLKQIQRDELDQLEKMVLEPYFARLIVEEEVGDNSKSFEYRIGLAENSDCRIIDWRRAPVAKLYYEYREGDEYNEEIQGRDRCGKIVTRNNVEIKSSQLKKIHSSAGSFQKTAEGWQASGGQVRSGETMLPQIASLLTKEQFALINENADRALLIQGIAGSGKTTIALHRLAFLVGKKDNPIDPSTCLVVVLSQSLKHYISKTLPSLGVQGVHLKTLPEWLSEQVAALYPSLAEVEPHSDRTTPRRPESPCPASIDRVKRSMAILRALEDSYREQPRPDLSAAEFLLALLQQPQFILDRDETKLLSVDVLRETRSRSEANLVNNVIDRADDPLLLRLYQLQNRQVQLPSGTRGLYEHIIADEVQDLGPTELAAIMGSAKNPQACTLIGDTAQKMDGAAAFPGWDKLRRYWSLKDSISNFVKLDLNFRSTVEIRLLAEYIQKRSAGSSSMEGRRGRVPIWFKCLTEDRAIQASQDWLERALNKYPTTITAVVCKDTSEAKAVANILRPRFGAILRLADEQSFSFEAGIVICDVASVRGLEFTNLLLWNPSRSAYPDNEDARNRLYVALSRARENVSIVTWGKISPLLPHPHSKLIRLYDFESDEVDAEKRESRSEQTEA